MTDSNATTHHSTTSVTTTADGRRIAADLTGPADGPLVLLSTAAPGSRRFDPDPVATRAAGVRLLTLDRPGYGGSDPLPGGQAPTMTGAADDAAAVLDDLGIASVGAAGWSAGGRVVLALAARRPDLVHSLAVVATPAPHDEVAWIGAEELGMIQLLLDDPEPVTTLCAMLAPMTADPSAAVEQLCAGAADAATLGDPAVRDAVVAMLAEAFVQGPIGLATDLVSYTVNDWGFDARSVGAPMRGFYGEDDELVVPAHGQWYVDQVADGSLQVVPESGHLVVCEAWADVLCWLAR
jgi:pimeloyl-ACP methyl ester carboxylesterase